MRARPETSPDAECGAFAAIEVDFSALTQLLGMVRGVSGELTGNGDLCVHVNDPDLADVFSAVTHNWHKQLVTLQTFLDMTADALATAVVAYRVLETNLAQASHPHR